MRKGKSNRLPMLAAEIKRLHGEHRQLAERSVARAIEAGEYLIEAKQQLKHGAWLPWLHEHCSMSERTAHNYMNAARHKETIQKRNVANLSLRGALRGLKSPKNPSLPIGPMPGAPHRVMLAPSNWPSDIAEHYRCVTELTQKHGVNEQYWRQLCDLRAAEQSERGLLTAFAACTHEAVAEGEEAVAEGEAPWLFAAA